MVFMSRFSSAVLLLALALLQPVSSARAAEWPQWRGVKRDGFTDQVPLPAKLEGGALQKLWRVELEPGYSGPVVSSDRVFTTETENRENEVVRALDRRTGKELWRASWPGAMKVPFFAKANGDWIRATPAYDGERLYVAGMCDVLVCLDAANGRELWRFDFVTQLEAPLPAFGFTSSPVIDGDAVIVQAGGGTCRLDKRTGKLLWRSLVDGGGMSGSAFASPVLGQVAGRRQLIVQTRTQLAGLNPTDGKELWSQPVEAFRGMNILTPTLYEDGLFTSTYGGETSLFKVSPAGEDRFAIAKKWALKLQGYMTTPVILNGMAIELNRDQRLVAVDLESGDKRWEVKDKFGKYWSLVTDGTRVLALDQKGELLLFQPTRDGWNPIDRLTVTDSEAWAHLAVVDGALYVRDLAGLTAWTWSAP